MNPVSGSAVVAFGEELHKLTSEVPFTVFLCGPSLNQQKSRPSADLRHRLIEELKAAEFDVVLGEDDGLQEARINVGLNAQDNELEFIRTKCNAIVLLADSVGSFCELGLFSWHFVHKEGRITKDLTPTFVVLVDREYEADKSYLNEGPVGSLNGFGDIHFIDYASFDTTTILKKLKNVRSVRSLDRRGRPKAQK